VAHNVSMMVVQAGAAARVLRGEQPDVRNALDVIAATGRETVDDMRTLLGVLRSDDGPDALKPQPGLADLERLIGGVREAGLPVTLRFEGAQRPLPPAIDLSAFRIVQEALTNTLKHAGPAQAQVTVRYQDAAIELEIADIGCGLALARGSAQASGPGHLGPGSRGPGHLGPGHLGPGSRGPGSRRGTGHGLVGMRERAAMFGGELETATADGGGFAIRARLPLAASS
jgi:signal transduction histidine kinase